MGRERGRRSLDTRKWRFEWRLVDEVVELTNFNVIQDIHGAILLAVCFTVHVIQDEASPHVGIGARSGEGPQYEWYACACQDPYLVSFLNC